MSEEITRIIKGNIDENGFMFIPTIAENKENKKLFQTERAIIDTGASISLVKESVFKKLKITKKEKGFYKHPTKSNVETDYFYIIILIDIENKNGSFAVRNVKCGILKDVTYPSDIIIGMNVLRNFGLIHYPNNIHFELIIP